MCGIVLLAQAKNAKSPFNFAPGATFTQMLFADEVRGPHSTGIIGIPGSLSNLLPIALKDTLPASKFIHLPEYKAFQEKAYAWRFMIGHNRLATRGGINYGSAHPFCYKNIMMVHNGTLTSMGYLPEATINTSDSARIAVALAEWGAKKTLERLHGAFTLVWYDFDTRKVYAARNEERPFSFCFDAKGDYMLAGSEMELLLWAASRNALDIPKDKRFDLDPGVIVSWDSDSTDLENYEVENFKIYTPPPSVTKTQSGWGGAGFRQPTSSKNGGGYHGNSGSVSSTKTAYDIASDAQRERIQRLLTPYDIKVGERITFVPTEFVHYSEGKKTLPQGTLFGVTEVGDRETLDVEVYFFPEKMDNPNHEEYSGVVWHAYKSEDNKVILGILYESTKVSVFGVEPNLSDIDAERLPFDNKRLHDNKKGYSTKATIPGPAHTMLTQKEFDTMTKNGCNICSKSLKKKDAKKLQWTLTFKPICPKCAGKLEQDSEGFLVA